MDRIQSHGSSRAAFTLVEMLAAIATVAVLAAMIIPAVQKMRAKAQGVQCMGNLRQIGVGMNLFVNENGYFPGATATQIWHTYIGPFVPANRWGSGVVVKSAFLCPTAQASKKYYYVGGFGDISLNLGGFYSSYAYNWDIEERPEKQVDGRGMAPTAITDGLSKTILVIDGATAFHLHPSQAGPSTDPGTRVNYCHEKSANALFCDGHIESFRDGSDLPRLISPVAGDN